MSVEFSSEVEPEKQIAWSAASGGLRERRADGIRKIQLKDVTAHPAFDRERILRIAGRVASQSRGHLRDCIQTVLDPQTTANPEKYGFSYVARYRCAVV